MNVPLYKSARSAYAQFKAASDKHAGLWHEKFFDLYPDSYGKLPDNACSNWIESSWPTGVVGDPQELDAFHARFDEFRIALSANKADFACDWHLASGLGNPHPLENGFMWHPTLGVPYLPSSGIKGLLRAWLVHWCNERALATAFLGDESLRDTGNLIIFDALPLAPVRIRADVMTPHLADWYLNGAAQPGTPDTVPADWHNPVPVTFIVVKEARFRVVVGPRVQEATADVALALDRLAEAFNYLGVGAKTAAGYGRLHRLP